MNNQEAFTKAALHLLKQGKPAKVDDACRYRGENSTTCALGCLFPDSEYDPAMEDATALQLLAGKRPGGHEFTPPPSLAGLWPHMLTDLQRIHDTYHPWVWRDALASMAMRYNLTMPEVPA